MHVTRFSVRGFKNLASEVVLDNLENFNVLHGPNNVGKSNVLQALDLAFYLLTLEPVSGTSAQRPSVVSSGHIEPRYLCSTRELYNLTQPAPIELSVCLDVSREDLARAGLVDVALEGRYDITWKLDLGATGTQNARLERFEHRSVAFGWSPNGKPDQQSLDEVFRLLRSISRNFSVEQPNALYRGCSLITTDRQLVGAGAPPSREILAPDLAEFLYDAFEDPSRAELYERWLAFREVWLALAPQAGLPEGEPRPTYNRQSKTATLTWESAGRRTPFRLLGSGLQHVAALTARIVQSGAAIVAVEEPETHLNFTLQVAFARALEKLTQSPYGPRQLLLSTHSPAFETAAPFFGLEPGPNGPTVRRVEPKHARAFLGVELEAPTGGAPISYVTREGLVRVPDFARKLLGVEQGGSVLFVRDPATQRLQVLTHEQYFAELGSDADAE